MSPQYSIDILSKLSGIDSKSKKYNEVKSCYKQAVQLKRLGLIEDTTLGPVRWKVLQVIKGES